MDIDRHDLNSLTIALALDKDINTDENKDEDKDTNSSIDTTKVATSTMSENNIYHNLFRLEFAPGYTGWLDIYINTHLYRASYLDDIPIDWLTTIKFFYENKCNLPVTFSFDQEDSLFLLITSNIEFGTMLINRIEVDESSKLTINRAFAENEDECYHINVNDHINYHHNVYDISNILEQNTMRANTCVNIIYQYFKEHFNDLVEWRIQSTPDKRERIESLQKLIDDIDKLKNEYEANRLINILSSNRYK